MRFAFHEARSILPACPVPSAALQGITPPAALQVLALMGEWTIKSAFGLPLALVLSSCIVLPIPRDQVEGHPVTADPKVVLHAGITTRDEVIARLGQPTAIWEEKRIFAYSWDQVKWAMLWLVGAYSGMAGGVVDLPTHHMLLIQFDENDRVKRVGQVDRPNSEAYGKFLVDWANGAQDGKP